MLIDKEILKRGKDMITPFSEDNVNCISYDLDIEGYVDEKGNVKADEYKLQPGESVMIKTIQSVRIPKDIVGIIGERNSKIRQGLSVAGPHYFPGHETSVYLRVTNLSPCEIDLKPGSGIAQIFFEQLNEIPERTYDQQLNASFNNEIEYLGFGNYTSEYQRQMRNIQKASDKLEHIESTMYGNILTLMGIFVSVFSLIIVNFANAGMMDSSALIKLNLSMAFVICTLMGIIIFFVNSKDDKVHKSQKWFVWLMAVAFVMMVIALAVLPAQ